MKDIDEYNYTEKVGIAKIIIIIQAKCISNTGELFAICVTNISRMPTAHTTKGTKREKKTYKWPLSIFKTHNQNKRNAREKHPQYRCNCGLGKIPKPSQSILLTRKWGRRHAGSLLAGIRITVAGSRAMSTVYLPQPPTHLIFRSVFLKQPHPDTGPLLHLAHAGCWQHRQQLNSLCHNVDPQTFLQKKYSNDKFS